MDFSKKKITSGPAVDTKHVDRRQECRGKSIAKVLQSEYIVLIHDLDGEIADDEQDVSKVTASEALIVWMLRSVLLKFIEISR